MKQQWYLIYSQKIPTDLWLFTEALGTGKNGLMAEFAEDFGQKLKPLGEDLSKAGPIIVPEGTKYAGIAWGDGKHFDEYTGSTWGILGEIERVSSDRVFVRGVNGDIVAEIDGVDSCNKGVPHVMPPEAFGLTRKPWWNDEYVWCNS